MSTQTTLPPDPEGENRRRAAQAGRIIEVYAETFGEIGQPQQNAVDLLSNLAHYCDLHGLKLAEILGTAAMHYRAETDEQGGQFPIQPADDPAALNSRETATILHALRVYQDDLCEGDSDEDGDCLHFDNESPLTAEEIDALCERLNFHDVAANLPTPADSATFAARLLAAFPWLETDEEDISGADTIAELQDIYNGAKWEAPPAPPAVVVVIEGGNVRDILATAPITAAVIDYDTQGADAEDIIAIPQGDGRTVDGFASLYTVEVARGRTLELLDAAINA